MKKLKISDYGGIHFREFDLVNLKLYRPSSEEEFVTFLNKLLTKKIGFSFSGGSHTFNGSSIPEPNKYHLDLTNYRWYKCHSDNILEVASGCTVWDIRDFVQSLKLNLRVWNGGFAGPTIGGYLLSGGFGRSGLSEKDGGLWEIVEFIKVVVPANGVIKTIRKSDAIFKWIFGSKGTLVIISSVGLKLEKSANNELQKGKKGILPLLQPVFYERHKYPDLFKYSPYTSVESQFLEYGSKLFWFSHLIYPESYENSIKVLSDFHYHNSSIIKPTGGWVDGPREKDKNFAYKYYIKQKSFIPPLLMNKNEDFLVTGIMSYLSIASKRNIEEIKKVSKNFINLTIDNGLRLYHQAEDFFNLIDYKTYYDKKTWAEYINHKKELDPSNILPSL